MEPPLVEQLKGHAPKKDLEILDRMSSAITLLYIKGILPPRQVDTARKKLMKRIINQIKP